MRLAALAPAKVNLFLHVGPLAPDGYHPVASLMAFADVGDRLTLDTAQASTLVVTGSFAAALAGEDIAANLAWRALERLGLRLGPAAGPFRLTLDKVLPVAAGLGGGSSDAGAALRLARALWAPELEDAVLQAVAAELGADGPACLHARPVLGLDRGDRLVDAPAMPPLPAVLANPGVACPTGAVYRAYDAGPVGGADLPSLPAGFASVEAVVGLLAACRNDLEVPAARVAPEVGAVLARLRGSRHALLTRLSGSGATAFALCASMEAAEALATELGQAEPGWWVRACRLGAPSVSPDVITTA